MSRSAFLITVLVAWPTIGVALALLLGRRGHSGFTWMVLGGLFGPLAIALAISSGRSDEVGDPRVVSVAEPRTGPVDVLVGFDDSEQSRAAVRTVIDLVGPRLGRLTLASVIPFDGGSDEEREALQALEAQAARLTGPSPGLEVLRGHPATALDRRARDAGYHLLVIGRRGGRAHLMGSAAAELARSGATPVLVVAGSDTT